MTHPTPAAQTGFQRSEAAYSFCASLFVVVLVLTNVIGTKLFVIPNPGFLFQGEPWTLTTGIITYPLTFLLTDLVSEIWGRRRANFMVLAGFVMSILMLLILCMAVALPPSSLWSWHEPGADPWAAQAMQSAFQATFSNPSVLLFASMLAYLVAQLFDVRLYHFLWQLTGGKHMWLRNNGSTLISQLVDTTIVNSIFLHFAFGMQAGAIVEIILAVYLCKVVLAAIDTPLIYLARGWMESFLGIEPDSGRSSAPLA